MASDQLIAVATDALRGLVQAAVPPNTAVMVGAPSPDGEAMSGLSVHLFRIGVLPVVRAVPVLGMDGRRTRPEVGLQVDYLLTGLGGEALQELGLLGNALQVLADSPVRERTGLAALLSQPDRLNEIPKGSITLQWRVLDLPIDQQCQVWLASGMKQRAGVFCRADVIWQALQDGTGAPVLERNPTPT
ncbi:MAG: Pvc16 family protein [Pseudoxanthomonas sp.]